MIFGQSREPLFVPALPAWQRPLSIIAERPNWRPTRTDQTHGSPGWIAKAAAGDPYFGRVVLLMGYEGANGSTGAPGMTDESPSAHGTATVQGNAQIGTAAFKFGTASLLLDGNGDYIEFTAVGTTDFRLSAANSDQFTIEFWARSTTTTPASKFPIWRMGGAAPQFDYFFGTDASSQLQFAATTDGTNFWSVNPISVGITWVIGQWYHIACDKDSSGKVRVYRDGAMIASGTPVDSSMVANDIPLDIGSDPGTAARSWPGNIEEVRFTKGIARYASDAGHPVPTAAFPRF